MVNDKLNEILRLLRQGLGATVPAAAVTPAVAPAITRSESSHQPQIFIGSSAEGLPVAESIQLGLNEAAECTVWNQSAFDPSRTTLESRVDISREFDCETTIFVIGGLR